MTEKKVNLIYKNIKLEFFSNLNITTIWIQIVMSVELWRYQKENIFILQAYPISVLSKRIAKKKYHM